MGCNSSKALGVGFADDSIHRMIVRDQMKREKEGTSSEGLGFKARQEHPLLQDDAGLPGDTVLEEEDHTYAQEGYSQEETDRLLYHTTNHNSTVDPRDEILAASA
uniref:Uncharacterized protein n=1 Tax=Entomoneis paludosa TaxID=265537 RepID=A0A7S2Y7E6_9STRA|mmetsp:Transcript_20709/g.43344  ORF Transcript_20709/g.43344 Transcript_20709/m.43344 type:complete len:105 (+) Transcript_20709:154-468(+)|eukprot:CAMPEP_0172441276 /NCGR_PEP_ID=MMETSP1065-20121228/1830_1 /TAXON_ID=265537 /ORGANISM="Amphiprora paludosa, Strain CCMP125" /LENGTH=104 /DNA_ID=CAMNT_0013190541 /DNA_START=79 /DNA_END=393 /DNA_ORIENTATION=+